MITLKEKQNTLAQPLYYSNVNMFWGSIIFETLARLGVQNVVVSPGSRSGPLTIASATNKKLKTIPVLDERSAGFFALGLAKKMHKPVVLVCSSGTAAANFYPAIIEARMSKIPLIVLTADRPPELRECHSGQAIDQVKLYSDYPTFYKELALPEAKSELFYYLRQTIMHAFECSLEPQKGPVHLNIPFRDPLSPVLDEEFVEFIKEFDVNEFFDSVINNCKIERVCNVKDQINVYSEFKKTEKGLIIVGTYECEDAQEFVTLLSQFSNELGWPVLAEGLSPVRNYEKKFSHLISRYDFILRNQEIADSLRPEQIIQIGNLPTSKILRAWLKSIKPKTWILESSFDNNDLLHNNTSCLRMHASDFLRQCLHKTSQKQTVYGMLWNKFERESEATIEKNMRMCETLFEGKVAWILSERLPKGTPVFVSTSMPVRDVEYFWQKNNLEHELYFNRGANGIDGLVSTALGIAQDNKPSVLLIGDLSLLHDGNGLLLKNYFSGSLTIILINNNGGRIFEFLPVSGFRDIFEEYFATPQGMNFEKFAHYHGLDYHQPKSWEDFQYLIKNLPERGIRMIEIITESNFDVAYRKKLFNIVSESLKK